MARKTTDIAMLLGARTKSRSRRGGGFGSVLIGLIDNLLGRTRKGGRKSERRRQSVSVSLFAIGLLVAFGGGFLVGGSLDGSGQGTDALRAVDPRDVADSRQAAGRAPTFVDEVDTRPLSADLFVVSAYPKMPSEEARTRAVDLSKYLVGKGFANARAYPWPQDEGVLWLVAVYFDGEQEAEATRRMLEGLTNVPDKMFDYWRKSGSDWPTRWQIQ